VIDEVDHPIYSSSHWQLALWNELARNPVVLEELLVQAIMFRERQ